MMIIIETSNLTFFLVLSVGSETTTESSRRSSSRRIFLVPPTTTTISMTTSSTNGKEETVLSSSASEAASDSRTSRAARKARRGTTTTESSGASRGRGGGASGSSSRSPQQAPPGTVDASRAKAEAEKLMDYDNVKQAPSVGAKASTAISNAEADKLMDYDRHKPAGSSTEADGVASMARAQAESNKSFQTSESSKSMTPGNVSSKSMGIEEMTRQKKEAELQSTSAEQPTPTEQPANGEEIVSAVVVDEDALEAEYQQRLMENVVSAEVMDQKEIDRRNRRRCICRCCCPLILVGVILAIVIPLTKEDPETITKTQPPSESPTPQAVDDYLAEILGPISGDKIYEEGTAQNQAFNWLLYEDPAMLDIKSENISTLINRYSFATIYFETDGANWNNQLHFLSNRSVCDWHEERHGVLCTESGEPFFLRFSRFF